MKAKTILVTLILLLGWSFSVSAQPTAQPELTDPQLEAGFPVQSYHSVARYFAGPGINTVAANIDGDPELEIVVTGILGGPLYAWNSDSTLVHGWPPNEVTGMAYQSAGNLAASSSTLEVVSEYYNFELNAYTTFGASLPGWPVFHPRQHDTPPVLADINGDGMDEIFTCLGENRLYGFTHDGQILPGWPVEESPTQFLRHLAIADLDEDGDLEIVAGTGSFSMAGGVLFAYHHDGSRVAGFPVNYLSPENVIPSIGDVDGDHHPEIVVYGAYPTLLPSRFLIFSASGVLERTAPLAGNAFYHNPIALADLDDDAIPEIILQNDTYLNVVRGDGSVYPGWPAYFGNINYYRQANSAPIVGDVNGDQIPEIVIMLQNAGTAEKSELRVYDRNGVLLPGFPKIIPFGSVPVPAIADIDRDGRNEIIAAGVYWGGYEGFHDHVWVYDLGGPLHGKIEWGQLGGAAHHRSVYPVPPPPVSTSLPPYTNYFPVLLTTDHADEVGIRGRILAAGAPQGNIPLELRYFNSQTWATIQQTVTGPDGRYLFTGAPALGDGNAYSVRYQNTDLLPGFLADWTSRSVPTFWSGSTVGITDFDIAGLGLQSPADGITVTIPATFMWQPRTSYVSEMFSLYLYIPGSTVKIYESRPYQNAIGLVLNALPTGFYFNVPYQWRIKLYGPDGSVANVLESRQITFTPSVVQTTIPITETVTPIYR